MSSTPGWTLGTRGAQVEIRVFYDLLCPASKAAHYMMKDLLSQESHIKGKKYSDIVDFKVSPFVLPYHAHSYQITQLIPYFFDKKEKSSFFEDYTEVGWAKWEEYLGMKNVSTDTFVKMWAKTIHEKFPTIPEQEILGLFAKGETHQTDSRVREMWKYGASIGVSGTPTFFVNGVKLDSQPGSVDEWKAFIKQLEPAPASKSTYNKLIEDIMNENPERSFL